MPGYVRISAVPPSAKNPTKASAKGDDDHELDDAAPPAATPTATARIEHRQDVVHDRGADDRASGARGRATPSPISTADVIPTLVATRAAAKNSSCSCSHPGQCQDRSRPRTGSRRRARRAKRARPDLAKFGDPGLEAYPEEEEDDPELGEDLDISVGRRARRPRGRRSRRPGSHRSSSAARAA